MDTTLAAEARTGIAGKGGARKLRKTGMLPAVVYGPGEEATPVAVDPTRLLDIFRKTGDRNTVINLQIDGAEVPCLVRDSQRHPLTRELLHVDFYKVSRDRKVEVMVKLETTGRARGMALGGRLRVIRREVPVRCDFDKIPAAIVHDITQMRVDDFVAVSQLAAPEGVEIVFESDYNVISIYGKKLAVDEEEEEEEAEASESSEGGDGDEG